MPLPDRQPERRLTLFDSTCLIVGIIVGAGIYETAPMVAQGAGNPWMLFLLWTLGGLLSLAGAICYAELATMYPREGGDVVYLTQAYGRWAGFLFGWIQLLIVRPGDIALMAFVFARYAGTLWFGEVPVRPLVFNGLAVGVVLLFSVVNLLHVSAGKWAQNLLTVLKVGGLLAITAIALLGPAAELPGAVAAAESSAPQPSVSFSLALILVLFTYGGWNEMAYAAAEIQEPRRNITRALLLGAVTVMLLYLLANAAFLHALGLPGMQASKAVASEAVERSMPELAARGIAVLVCVSALGALNGLIFTGARIAYAMGKEYPLFQALGHWQPRTGTPVQGLLFQAALTVLLIIALGSFGRTLLYTAAAVYTFYLATSLSVIVLRWKDPQRERPYRAWGYPATPLLFAGACALLIVSAIQYDWKASLISWGIMLIGIPAYRLSRKRGGHGS